MLNQKLKRSWVADISAKFIGRKIVAIRYMTDKEVKSVSWSKAAVVIALDDGTLFYPMADDEGNNAGALATSCDDLPVIPVI